jgi:endonuclease G
MLAACGGDDTVIIPRNTFPPIDDGTSVNTNKNTSGPKEAQTRYEFPNLSGGTSDIIVHSTPEYGVTYSLEWDHQKRATRWVCWEVNNTNRIERYSRNQLWPNGDPWAYDPSVPQNEQQATYSELSKSYYPGYTPGVHRESDYLYQKGHICASQDRIYSKEANQQTFYMTNIYPQVGNFNGKLWAKLESQVRKWGPNDKVNLMFVCKGGTIDKESEILDRTIGNHIVPKYFFMAIVRQTTKGISGIAFWMEHLNEDRSNDPLSLYAMSIDELERKTGIDFFCNLPDNTENAVEATLTLSDWNLK